MFETELLQVKNVGELELRVVLDLLPGVVVQLNTLQLEDQSVGCLGNQGSLLEIDLLLATWTVIALDLLTRYHELQTVMDGLHVLDSETDVEEVLESVSCEATLFTHHLGAVLAVEYCV